MRCKLYNDEELLHDQIVGNVSEVVSLGGRGAQWSPFRHYSCDGSVPSNWASVQDGELLKFMIPTKIVAESASNWSSVQVEQLRIRFVDVAELNLDINLSEKANALV